MKYVLKNTAYRAKTETVEELYLNDNELSVYFHTDKLSETRIFDRRSQANRFMKRHRIDSDHKIVEIEDKDLFEARLAGI